MKKRTKIIIAVAVYVVLVSVFLLLFGYFYQDHKYSYQNVQVYFKDKTIEYTIDDFSKNIT